MISQKEFVRKWIEAFNNGHNQSWIAKELGRGTQAISNRASYLRKRGVKLPILRNGKSTDVEALNRIIEAKLKK